MMISVLGIDYGLKRVGVAVGNTISRTAEPLKIILRTDDNQVIHELQILIKEWQIGAIAIGIPRHPDDTAHQMTAACLSFAEQLQLHFALPISEIDERYSSAVINHSNKRQANGNIRTNPQDDKAAAIILQQYLDQL